jgi:phage anti-repressor protein
MNELIHIEAREIAGVVEQTCDARNLHSFLEVGKDFSTWIKDRIEQYGFVEGKDFCSFLSESRDVCSPVSGSVGSPQNRGKPLGGRPSIEYSLTLDMGKELAMVERTEKGKQARQYFLECERRAKSGVQQNATQSAIAPAKEFRALFGVARLVGMDKNAAALSANQAVTKLTGTNVLKLLGHTHLEAENQEALFFTPTELGERMNISGRKFNMLLAEAGLQAKKGEHWVPLTTAEGFCRIMDTGKRHGDGTMIQQVKWADNVLALVEKAAA